MALNPEIVLIALSPAMTGAVLVVQMLKIAHPGYAPAVFVTVLLLGLILAVLGSE